MSSSEYEGVMVFAQQKDGKVHPVTYELLGKGREMADKIGESLFCVLLGSGMEEVDELIYHGADRVFLYDDPSLQEFNVLHYKKCIVDLVEEEKPKIFLLGATTIGRSLGPRVAAALRTGLTADCTSLDVDEEGNLIQIRPAFSGSVMATIKTPKSRPQMATVRYRVMEEAKRDTSRRGEAIKKRARIEDTRIRVLERKEFEGEGSIVDADIIVSGGRGLKKAEDLRIIREVADLLKGAVGASRPIVDDRWIGRQHQVGLSGNTVRPKLYIACGISGSVQHLAGMRNSNFIIAINKDPSAPIFKEAHYGFVEDLYELLPELIAEIKRRRGMKTACITERSMRI
ncbi:MAG: electron transfer flavoprotein subunit alpha/FixB family protein [archaeon]|nr:electron transfer flavoprotein subunit alpha/FixB family protein [archaeon]MCP8305531.1 electron transfer flavoprotein subunit alpha/FixB family protein [archaeon]